ncbi:SO2930 family diheme c-type cytochrome [Sphingobacterium sp. HMA12]|uniref:SO2930 family diheme c-type cytochrome n=1 Tax=Sphingobacterium sp. HMA12 TaxID=2050894 RepID=UPI0013154ECA|nr:SO2930 family diheme c-type cytochrome [Sphingobacterium sp. HMA12]
MKNRKLTLIGIVILSVFFLTLQQSCRPGENKSEQLNNSFVFKEKLSGYGFFKGKLRDLLPKKGVIPYELSTPLFSDYTVKDRFIILPQGKSVEYTAQGPLDFPDSTIIVKNFSYINVQGQKIIIETRLLVKDPADHNWKVMNYLWNAALTNAVKHIRGAKLAITLVDNNGNRHKTSYMVPNTNDCKRCHNNASKLMPIGPKARNLNFVRSGDSVNQLAHWSARGLLKNMPDLEHVAQLPVWTDKDKYSLENRARAYLDVNCAHCHTKGGDAFNTGLFLNYEEDTPAHLGVDKAPVSAGGGAGGLNYDIIPGDSEHSILLYRMNSIEPGTSMPELARSIIHKEGVDLIRQWIDNMPKKK